MVVSNFTQYDEQMQKSGYCPAAGEDRFGGGALGEQRQQSLVEHQRFFSSAWRASISRRSRSISRVSSRSVGRTLTYLAALYTQEQPVVSPGKLRAQRC